MFSQRQAYFIIGFMLIITGCASTNINKTVDKKENKITKQIEIKVDTPKKIEVKKLEVKKIKTNRVKAKKKILKYKYCNKYIKIMNHASKYIKEEFNKGYFIKKDVIGAKAQLFLIESNSQSIFAKNINNALNSYKSQYEKAKKNRCNLSKYKISPLEKVKLKLEKLEKYMLKKEAINDI